MKTSTIISFELNPDAKRDFEKYLILLNGEMQIYHGEYLCGTKYQRVITAGEDDKNAALEVLSKDGDEFPFRIKKFSYNGFFGNAEDSYIKETGRFVKWTGDPGIALMMLSNGKLLSVPTFAIPGSVLIPIDETYSQKIIFGKPSQA